MHELLKERSRQARARRLGCGGVGAVVRHRARAGDCTMASPTSSCGPFSQTGSTHRPLSALDEPTRGARENWAGSAREK